MENKGCCMGKPADNTPSAEKTGEKTGGCGGMSKCCPGTIFKGALVGGAVMFIYFSVSWMVLPWHKDIMALGNERMAATLLVNLAPKPGIYVLPEIVDPKTGAVGPSAVVSPYAFISVFPAGIHPGDMKKALLGDFLFCLFGAALLTKVLKKRREGCCPVAGSVIIGVLVASFSYLPNMIWFHFPLHFSLVGMADDVIAITLAGAAISAAVLKSAAGSCGCPVCKCEGPCNCPCCCKKTGSCDDKKGDCSDKKGSCG